MASHFQQQIPSAKRDVAQRESTLQQLSLERDSVQKQRIISACHINPNLCLSLEDISRKEMLSNEADCFSSLQQLFDFATAKKKRFNNTSKSSGKYAISITPSDSNNNDNDSSSQTLLGDSSSSTGNNNLTTPSKSNGKSQKSPKKDKKKKSLGLWGNSGKKKKQNDDDEGEADEDVDFVNSSGEDSDDDENDKNNKNETKHHHHHAEYVNSEGNRVDPALLRRNSKMLSNVFEGVGGSAVAASALSREEFLLSPKTAKALAAARQQQVADRILTQDGFTQIAESLSPNSGGANNNTNSSSSSQQAPPVVPESPAATFFKNLFSFGGNNNNNSSATTTTTASQQQQSAAASSITLAQLQQANNIISSHHRRESNMQLSYDEEILINSKSIQDQFKDTNPNQLGELLLNPHHPMWYTGKCLSAAIRTYFSKQVVPETVVLSNSHEEQNVAAMATSVMNTAVSTASTVVDTATNLFGALIAKTTDFVTGNNNNNSSNNNNSNRSAFGFGGSNKRSNENDDKPVYTVEPIWLHMENNDIVVGSVQPSVFLPFPSFNEHNSDEKLQSLYREMARRSALERMRREGTGSAITPTGAAAVHRSNSSASTTKSHYQQQQQQQNQQQQLRNSNNVRQFNSKDPDLTHFIRNEPRPIRADEFRIAFFASDIFKRIHAALDFDPKDLVKHAIFDLVHPWRVAHSPGKSESTFFFFGHFVAKSLKEHEFKFFYEKFLPKYLAHVEINKFTLLPRFLALISVADLSRGTVNSPQIQRLVIMNNVFPTTRVIHRMYDLKGSTINRDGLSGDVTRTTFGAVLLKDNDLPPKLLLVGPVRSRLLTLQLRCDTDFLNSLSIIDYSLLVGVRSERVKVGPGGEVLWETATARGDVTTPRAISNRNKSRNLDSNSNTDDDDDDETRILPSPSLSATSIDSMLDGSCFRSWDGGMPSLPVFDVPNDMTSARVDTFYIGLIDVLQNFSAAKRLEATTKGFIYSGQASVVPPDEFAERICASIERIVQ